STDAPGAIELFSSDEVGVPLVFLQGAAGDVSPDSAAHGDFQGTEYVGRAAARKVLDAWERAAPGPAAPRQTLLRYELPLEPSRAAIGYAPGEFPENGGAGCGLGERHCPPVEVDPKSIVCIPLKRRPFRETSVEAVQVGPVLLGTLPGEPTTAEGEKVKAAGARVAGVTNVLTVGYAQDHFGYLLEEKDYLRLGYEPYVSPLGWRFGDFIEGRLEEAFGQLGTESPPMARPTTQPFTPRVNTPSEGPARQLEATRDLQRLEAAELVFEGGDPGLGTPTVSLEREVDGLFAPVRASPVRWVEGGPDIVLFYEPSPSAVSAPAAQTRLQRWRAVWETLADTPLGRYRLVARGRTLVGGEESTYLVTGNAFTVSASEAFASATVRVSPSGQLSVVARLAPNPSVRDATGTVVRNFRLRDEGARGNEGARARGGVVRGVLTLPDGTAQSVELTWDAARSGYFAAGVPVQSGPYRLVVAPSGLQDDLGNTNRAELVAQFVAP
ncbi:MAG: hypothetical protein JNM17_14380, partial [Archangium sp.]|nr:hypothetical protein [Archangium sp.]